MEELFSQQSDDALTGEYQGMDTDIDAEQLHDGVNGIENLRFSRMTQFVILLAVERVK